MLIASINLLRNDGRQKGFHAHAALLQYLQTSLNSLPSFINGSRPRIPWAYEVLIQLAAIALQVDLEQLDVQLGRGTLELRGVLLNCDYLNEQLVGSQAVCWDLRWTQLTGCSGGTIKSVCGQDDIVAPYTAFGSISNNALSM